MAMSSSKAPDHQSGWQYSSKPEIDGGMIEIGHLQATGDKRKREQEEKRTIVLALPAVNNKQMKNEGKEKEKESEKTRVETQNCDGDGDDGDDGGEFWPHLFAQQLIKMNEGHIPKEEEDIPMIPNHFFKDLLQL